MMVSTPFAADVLDSPGSDVHSRSDRRRQLRFPFSLRLRYSLASGVTGEGRLVNISSGGILFRCGAPLPVGRTVQLVLPWPTLLNGSCPLQLRITARIIRSGPSEAAAQIQRYAFHTAAKKAPALTMTAAAGPF